MTATPSNMVNGDFVSEFDRGESTTPRIVQDKVAF